MSQSNDTTAATDLRRIHLVKAADTVFRTRPQRNAVQQGDQGRSLEVRAESAVVRDKSSSSGSSRE